MKMCVYIYIYLYIDMFRYVQTYTDIYIYIQIPRDIYMRYVDILGIPFSPGNISGGLALRQWWLGELSQLSPGYEVPLDVYSLVDLLVYEPLDLIDRYIYIYIHIHSGYIVVYWIYSGYLVGYYWKNVRLEHDWMIFPEIFGISSSQLTFIFFKWIQTVCVGLNRFHRELGDIFWNYLLVNCHITMENPW